jgi:hypothetical protein
VAVWPDPTPQACTLQHAGLRRRAVAPCGSDGGCGGRASCSVGCARVCTRRWHLVAVDGVLVH